MKKSELKAVLKPLIKECIKEVIFEEGVLSGIISEVVQGMGAAPLVERQERPLPRTIKRDPDKNKKRLQERNEKMAASRKKMLDAIGNSYNGVDLFEGTKPISKAGKASKEPPVQGPLTGMDPGDPGVDISSLLGEINYKGVF